MKKLLLSYNFILTLVIAGAALSQARRGHEVLYGLLFVPMAFYFGRLLYRHFIHPHRRQISSLTRSQPASRSSLAYSRSVPLVEGEAVVDVDVADINRRMFVKLIGAAGLSTFVFALFSKSAHAAFFGSVPGPGTIAIKDSAGNKIDPSEKQPTDGFEISQVDDSNIPAYYGFLNKDGAWYVAREGAGGEYRYSRGNNSFANNWDNRNSLAYGYFDNIF